MIYTLIDSLEDTDPPVNLVAEPGKNLKALRDKFQQQFNLPFKIPDPHTPEAEQPLGRLRDEWKATVTCSLRQAGIFTDKEKYGEWYDGIGYVSEFPAFTRWLVKFKGFQEATDKDVIDFVYFD